MTSQYDIENGLSNLRKLDFDIKKLKENETPTKREKKQIKDKEQSFKKLNIKLTKWCNEFDSRIKPLDKMAECDNPDKIFVMRIPKYVKEKQSKKYTEEYTNFIKSQNYKIEGIDKQTGYINYVYSFFCKRHIEVDMKSIEEHLKK